MADLDDARERMIANQIARRGVRDPAILDAFRAVPREAFVPAQYLEYAYEDTPIPIEAGQTISQPYVVALMIAEAELSPRDRVLEIGAGSGYAAAVMSRIAQRVYAIERHGELVALARARFAALGYDNIELREGDGTHGWPEAAPFDVILASAAGPAVPQTLKQQLAVGGRLLMPVGETARQQRLVRVRRQDRTHFREEDLGDVAFVPLIGAHGFPE